METDPPIAPWTRISSVPADAASDPAANDAEALEEPTTTATSALVSATRPGESGWDAGENHDESAASAPPPQGRTWQQELPRWLATLDSGRTRREYEKAVIYFFATPGVPDRLEALTLDLLLAYRGSLALRAERQPAGRPASRPGPVPWMPARLNGTGSSQLPGGPTPTADGVDDTRDGEKSTASEEGTSGSPTPGPLAPATVNLRLTALRQFLAHCTLWDLVPQLSPERTRAALRRLAIERRRPYQILAEPEWGDFLAAARAPLESSQRVAATRTPDPGDTYAPTTPGEPEAEAGDGDVGPSRDNARPSPWGTPRTVKRRATGKRDLATDRPLGGATHAVPGAAPAARSTAGLTGARTARRDHALLALALATGLRAVELSLLDLGDLSREWHAGREEWWLILPDAKTKGQHGGRTLPLSPDLVQTLLDYARSTGREWERAADRETPLFLPFGCGPGRNSRRDGSMRRPRRLSLAQIRCIVDRAETQWLSAYGDAGRGSRAISPHALRHSTAIALLEGNTRTNRPPASVEHVRGWLGHVDIRTTQGYLAHLDDRRHHRPFTLEPLAAGGSSDDRMPPEALIEQDES